MDEIEKYYSELLSAYDSNRLLYRDNTDRLHNAAIMLLMLTRATSIKMYCGEMSIFRETFYNEIAKENRVLADEWKRKISEALRAFLADDSHSLEIVVENYNPELLNDFIISPDEIKRGQFQIFQLPDSIQNKHDILHFSFTGDEKIERIEIEKDKHTAICRIGIDKKKPTSSLAGFEKLHSLAVPA